MMSFVPPGILLGLILSAMYAGLFHLWGGRNLRDLLAFSVASVAGFALGQLIGMIVHLPLPHIGQVYIVEATAFSWLTMIGVRELRFGQQSQEADGV